MKRTFKVLLLIAGMFCITAFFTVDTHAQENLHPEFEGTWVMDSVQVKEVMPDSIVEKTVLPGGRSKFDRIWVWQFSLGANGKVSFLRNDGHTISDIPYSIEDMRENMATLYFNAVTDFRKFNAHFTSGKMIATEYFTTEYEQKDIEVSWKMYYSKIN